MSEHNNTKGLTLTKASLCSNCRWWDHEPFDEPDEFPDMGECRAAAPVFYKLKSLKEDYRGYWPYTLPEDWCRLFEAKDEQTRKD